MESRHAGFSAAGGFSGAPSNRAVDTPDAIQPTDYPSDSGSSVPPAQNNLPVPVLAEPLHSKLDPVEECESVDGGEARESTKSNYVQKTGMDYRGGQNIYLRPGRTEWAQI